MPERTGVNVPLEPTTVRVGVAVTAVGHQALVLHAVGGERHRQRREGQRGKADGDTQFH